MCTAANIPRRKFDNPNNERVSTLYNLMLLMVEPLQNVRSSAIFTLSV